jgi:hypothetical protein
MPPKSGVKKKPSPSPVHETRRRTTTVCGPLVRVEQKNGAVVREYIGYDRLEGFEEQALLSAAYNPVELQHNVKKAVLRLRQRLAQANRIKTQERT